MVHKLTNPPLFFDGRKSIALEQYPDEAWTFYSNAPDLSQNDYYKFIPTLYRAVDLRAGSVADMPFRLVTKGGDEYDSSASWENKCGFMPHPKTLLRLVEMSVTLTGKSYLFRERNRARTLGLRYLLPTGATPIIDPVKGLTGFKRPVNNVMKTFEVEDIVYFWMPDPWVEIGEPLHYPGMSAANACKVLLNMDEFSSGFFARGAIKAMLLTVKGMPLQSDREKLETWWSRVVGGVRNAFGARVINAETVTPVVLGEGMKELENVTLSRDKQEDVAHACGIPASILFANAANYATSEQDVLNYLKTTIIPQCEFIADILNEQVFDALGLRWEFLPETLDEFQEDERERADALLKVIQALGEPETFLIAAEILGYEIDDEILKKIEELVKVKEERREEMAEQLQAQPGPPQPGEVRPEPEPETESERQQELRRWQRKSLNALGKGKSPAVSFESDDIPADECDRIRAALAECKTAEEIRAVFTDPPEQPAEITGLISALRDAAAALRETA